MYFNWNENSRVIKNKWGGEATHLIYQDTGQVGKIFKNEKTFSFLLKSGEKFIFLNWNTLYEAISNLKKENLIFINSKHYKNAQIVYLKDDHIENTFNHFYFGNSLLFFSVNYYNSKSSFYEENNISYSDFINAIKMKGNFFNKKIANETWKIAKNLYKKESSIMIFSPFKKNYQNNHQNNYFFLLAKKEIENYIVIDSDDYEKLHYMIDSYERKEALEKISITWKINHNFSNFDFHRLNEYNLIFIDDVFTNGDTFIKTIKFIKEKFKKIKIKQIFGIFNSLTKKSKNKEFNVYFDDESIKKFI